MTGKGGAFGLHGYVHGRFHRMTHMQLFLEQGGCRSEAVHVSLQSGQLGPLDPNIIRGCDDRLDGGFYVSAVFPFNPDLRDGSAHVTASVTWNDGVTSLVRLCHIDILRIDPLPSFAPSQPKRVGIAMATYEPDVDLFTRQIASIQAQSHQNWICVISDDGSTSECRHAIKKTIGDDQRFHLLATGPQLGFYRNFERACAALPTDCSLIAFCDQDDAWRPDRLSRQLESMPDLPFACIYSDMRIVGADGTVLSATFWVRRYARYGSLCGLLLGNVVTGMTMLCRRALIEHALPFPATPNLTYHDHWIALVAARAKALAYVPEALVDYVQHGGNHTGSLFAAPPSRKVLAQALNRIRLFLQVGWLNREPVRALRVPFVSNWTDGEPARLRILVDRLVTLPHKHSDKGILRLTRNFGVLQFVLSGAHWRDRYRRAYAIELCLGRMLKVLIVGLIRAGFISPEPP